MKNQKKNILTTPFFLALLLVNNLAAQKITPFTVTNGLPSNTINCVYEAADHTLWIGTPDGLAKFTENQWEILNESNSGLVHNHVRAITQDLDNHLWFATNDGLSEFDGAHWKNYRYQEMPAYLRAPEITALFVDNRGNLWIGTKGGGVSRLSRQTELEIITPFDPGNSDLVSPDITAISQDLNGALWFGTESHGLSRFDGKTWEIFNEFNTPIGNKIFIIFRDSRNTLWFGSNLGVVHTIDGTLWDNRALENVPAVVSIAEDREGNLWFGTRENGLFKYDGQVASKPEIKNLPQNLSVNALIRDHSGYLWLGTASTGLLRLHLNWQLFTKWNSNLPENFVTSLAEDAAGNLWIGTSRQGLARLDSLGITRFKVANNIEGMNSVNLVRVDLENQIWCATQNGAHSFDGVSKWTSFRKAELGHQNVNTLIQDREGNFWFGTWAGVARFDGTTWTRFDTSNGLPDLTVTSILEDRDGALWFGTAKGGVCKFVNNKVVEVFNKANKLPDNQVQTIIQDQQNYYWFGTAGGLARFDGKTSWTYFSKANKNLNHDHVKFLFEDFQKNILAGTLGGGLNKYSNGFWLDMSENLESDSVYAVLQDHNRNFWFGTRAGLVKYTPDKIPPETFIKTGPAAISGVASNLFVFEGQDTETRREDLLYSWAVRDSLRGFVNQWSDFRSEIYQSVGPLQTGVYIFYVKTRDADGNEDPTPEPFNFMVDIQAPVTIISSPASQQIVTGKIAIWGSAFDSTSMIRDFEYYTLKFAAGDLIENIQEHDWQYVDSTQKEIRKPVVQDTLLLWDTSLVKAGSYFLRLQASDTLNHFSYAAVKLFVVEATDEILKDQGGFLTGENQRIQLYLPPGTFRKDQSIYCSKVDTNQLELPRVMALDFTALAYQIGPENVLPQKPMTLSLHYSDSDILNLPENRLSIIRLESFGNYELIGGTVKPEENQIATVIRELGTFILAADNSGSTGEVVLLNLNCQPRIFSPRGSGYAETTTISFQLTANAEVSVRIFNLAGRRVCVLTENQPMNRGMNTVQWNGRDYNQELCPADLYVVTVECRSEVKTKTVVLLDRAK